MELCRIVYGAEGGMKRSVADLKKKIKQYIRNKDFNLFITQFVKGTPEQSVIYTLTNIDPENTELKLMKDFIDDFQLAIDTISSESPKLIPQLNDLFEQIKNTLHIEMDRTQDFINPDPDAESKSTWEERDQNATRLYNHIKEIYGVGAYDIILSLQDSFKSDILAISAWDINSGTLPNQSNISLNLEIVKLKNRYYKQIVDYLKNIYQNSSEVQNLSEELYGDKLNSEYFKVMRLFYNTMKNNPNFNKEISGQQQDITNNTENTKKAGLYKSAVLQLLTDEKVKKVVLNDKKYRNKALIDKLSSVLYDSGVLSQYYTFIKDLVSKRKLENVKITHDNKEYTLKEVFEEIERPGTINLLSASKAYTYLTHFDELVKDSTDIIDVENKGNVLSTNNYHYKTASSHQKKGFLQSEAIDTEKYVAALTSGVMEQIRVFDHKTGMPKNRRVNSTTFIMAARNLVNDVIFNLLNPTRDNTLARNINLLLFTEGEDPLETYNLLINNFNSNENLDLFNKYKSKFEAVAKQLLSDPTIPAKSGLTRMLNQSEKALFVDVLQRLANQTKGTSYLDGIDNFKLMFVELHGHPENFGKILEMLFDKSDASPEGLAYEIDTRERLTDYDLDLLYSVYQLVYNRKNNKSLINASKKSLKDGEQTVNIIYEFSGFVDRNTNVDYLETFYDRETGLVKTKIKRKFYNGSLVFKDKLRINSRVNNMDLKTRQTLLSKYGFNTYVDGQNYTYYSVKLNGLEVSVFSPGKSSYKILSTKDTLFGYSDFFRKIDNVDLEKFLEKLMYGGQMDEGELNLYSALEFIDQFLDLQILKNPEFTISALQALKSVYVPVKGKLVGNNFIQPFVLLAIRAAYANKRFVDANGKNLAEYFSSISLTDDGIYQQYARNPKKSNKFTNKFNELKYTIASYEDEILEVWENAKSTINGDLSKSTTKDNEGNNIPNNSVNKLGSNIHYYLSKQRDTNVGDLMFVRNPNKITGIVHDLEVTTQRYDKKSVKAFTAPELFYHGIFNKFWGNYLNGRKRIIVLPTTYSDKTTFINYEVDTKIGDIDLMTVSNFKEMCLKQYAVTIGSAYKKIWGNTKEKLMKIANQYNLDQKQIDPNAQILGYSEVLKLLNEDLLIALARRVGVKLELDKDYRKVKGYCTINELLQYYAEDLYNIDNILNDVHLDITKDSKLAKLLKEQEKIFVLNLVDTNSTFLVIDFGVSYDKLTSDAKLEDSFSNPILNTIIKIFLESGNVQDRINYFKNWVDPKTGQLILAKQNGKNIIRNSIDSTQEVQLNPILERFFYVEGLISNNLRMSLTGSEINHPDKARDTLYNTSLLLIEEVDKLQNQFNDAPNDFERNKIQKQLESAKLKRNNYFAKNGLISSPDTLLIDLPKFDNINELRGSNNPDYLKIYESTMLSIANVAQGTQFKRNVIIPATLLYCLQNIFDGIKSKIKCAVIRDEKAHVYNYRGDHDSDIDSADGAAKICSFQSILENRSLGSQAVGFTKKPIWHSYNSEGGTAFLGKFATNTITNEEMRASSHSNTNLHNLFRKMTDLRWNGDIDLMQSIIFGNLNNASEQEINKWFLKRILRNPTILNSKGDLVPSHEHRLLYEDQYNLKVEIVGFNSTKTLDGETYYYTLEKPYTKTFSGEGVKQVYHMFYDEVTENGTVKSKHLTFDTWQAAKKFKDSNVNSDTIKNISTINSLYQLHTALGGINTVDEDGKSNEFSNEVVVNFMCEVGKVKPGTPEKALLNQTNVELPLKDYYIGYALNNTSVKNGALNINNSNRWYNDEDLDYFDVDSDGLGMQMNADHDIVDSELTEFSLVITATSAYGYALNYTSELFNGLAQSAILSSYNLITSVESFIHDSFGNEGTLSEHILNVKDIVEQIPDEEIQKLLGTILLQLFDEKISTSDFNTALNGIGIDSDLKTKLDKHIANYLVTKEIMDKARSDFYDAIGRIIFLNLSIKDKESLQHVIIGAVQNVFFNSKNHKLDDVKIPFSDPNIYSEFISTLASTINKESIKRKHPGSGCVIVPGYNIILYFEYGGKKLMTKDVLKNAREDYRQDLINSIKNSSRYNAETGIISFNGKEESLMNLENSDLFKLVRLINDYKVAYEGYYKNLDSDVTTANSLLISQWLKKQLDFGAKVSITLDMSYEDEVKAIQNGALMDNSEWFMPSDIATIYDENDKVLKTVDLDNLETYYKFKDGTLAIEENYDVSVSYNKEKNRWDISLNDDTSLLFRIESATNEEGKPIANEYNIHFRTGTINPVTGRRIKSVDLTPELLTRLFNAALQVIPDGSVLSLSPTTAEQIATKHGGLTEGSFVGYNSIWDNTGRRTGVELEEIKGSDYEVQYFDNDGILHNGFVKKYRKIKNNYKYQNSIASTHNLRPSVIRWKYLDNNGISHWMNIFDVDAIRTPFFMSDKLKQDNADYRADVLQVLHNLDNGVVPTGSLVEGSLENTAAELVMSNLYKDKFGIGNESLQEILDSGEEYFYNKQKTQKAPAHQDYDIAFLKDSGRHVLISLGGVEEVKGGGYILENPWDNLQLAIEGNEIFLMKGNLKLFKVGIFSDNNVGSVTYNTKTEKFEDGFGNELADLSLYRLKSKDDPTSVQRKIWFVKRHNLMHPNKLGNYNVNTIYEIAKPEIIESALPNGTKESAAKQIAKIIGNIYLSDNFKIPVINSNKTFSLKLFNEVKSALGFLRENYYISQDVKKLVSAQFDQLEPSNFISTEYISKLKDEELKQCKSLYLNSITHEDINKLTDNALAVLIPNKIREILKTLSEPISEEELTKLALLEIRKDKDLKNTVLKALVSSELKARVQYNKNALSNAQETFTRNYAHKLWVSFLDSQNWIAARIPAQTLQSFMSMKTIAWTENSTNMAYVSHFLTYLLGSDYDIDKAYIMGLSYSENGTYIDWSPMFNYRSYNTLLASKKIPVPKFKLNKETGKKEYHKVIKSDSGLDVTSYFNILAKYIDVNGEFKEGLSENDIIIAINTFADLVREIGNQTEISYQGGYKFLEKLLNDHYNYKLSGDVAELAYKNVASANIYNVAHDIRNRDLAYTAISMDIIRKASNKSPKGNQAAQLNMFNPLTKYLMQYQNILGKNVISIAANAEKVWFNAYNYWHKVLKNGTENLKTHLKFQLSFSRILGRSKGNPELSTIKHIPDLNKYDEDIKNELLASYGATKDSLEYKYVDLLISLLLSAATDNAKELILAKINAGTNYARMYVYGIMMGFNFDDLISFMTSPVAEYIDSIANLNIFSAENVNTYASTAISKALGKIAAGNFLHGFVETKGEYGEEDSSRRRTSEVKSMIENSEIYDELISEKELPEDIGLNDLLYEVIQHALKNDKDIDFIEMLEYNDTEISNYASYVDSVFNSLKNVINKYKNKYGDNPNALTLAYNDYLKDAEEFLKLYKLSSEVSSIASAWLGLNQGLPTSELEILQRLYRMSKTVSDREKEFGINKNVWPKDSDTKEKIAEKEKELSTIIDKIIENNPTLFENEDDVTKKQLIKDELLKYLDIAGNFNIYRYITDDNYKEQCIEYYDLIKGTFNMMEMTELNPNYNSIMECFKSLLLANKTLSSKSRLIDSIIESSELDNISDGLLKGIIRYVDLLNVVNYMKTLPIISVGKQINGFDVYFRDKIVDKINLGTQEGMATFKHWIENEFYNDISDKFKDNGFIKHIIKVPNNDQMILATDIDLLNPNVTTLSRIAYDQILVGISDLESKYFEEPSEINPHGITYADLFQMYNLITNHNLYGGERLTTIFKVCEDEDNALNNYLKFISKQDYSEEELEFNKLDYLIASAPIIYESQERLHSEPYVKVQDDVLGYRLKKRDNSSGKYVEIPILPTPLVGLDNELTNLRLKNYAENSTFEMPFSLREGVIRTLLDFKDFNEVDDKESVLKELTEYLRTNSLTNKILLYLDC